jgi:ElaB/YqjD/DUF883 family membrane-anchored ribosome-binding protein
MEANEAQELQEHAEHGAHEASLRPVAFTMSLLAVLVAVTTVLGHRTHTEAIIAQTRAAVEQNRATDMWGFYQAKNIRNTATELNGNLLNVLQIGNKKAAEKLKADYAKQEKKWQSDLEEAQKQAREDEDKVKEQEKDVTAAEGRANRFDLSEALLEIGLVITSVTLLTHRRIYWYVGLVASAGGILSALSVLLLK